MRRDKMGGIVAQLVRWLLCAHLLHLSIGLMLHRPSPLYLTLGGVEAVAALLFAFRRTLPWGALILSLVFAFAAGLHLRAGEGAAPLAGFALAVGGLTWLALRRPRRRSAALTAADRAFLRDFEQAQLVPADFHHRDHIRAAWAALHSYPLGEALAMYSAALRRLAARAGKPERYHETITWAYLLLIHERLASDAEPLGFPAFADRHADLLTWDPSVLAGYYPAEVLSSARARQVFVLPPPAAVRPAAAERDARCLGAASGGQPDRSQSGARGAALLDRAGGGASISD